MQFALLAGTAVVAALLSRRADWDVPLLLLLLGFALIAELDHLRTRRVYISSSFLAIVLSMMLLGPAPAVAVACALMIFDAVRRREGVNRIISNASIYAFFTLVGAWTFERAGGPGLLAAEDTGVVPLIVAVYFLTNVLNFALVAVDIAIVHRQSITSSVRRIYLPMLPVEVAGALLTVGVAWTYAEWGVSAIALIVVIGLTFQHLVKTAVQASERGEELGERNRQLAALQFGLIRTTLKTLSLRDHMTARHSAAVARYAREIAREIGLSEEDEEIVHTAALFHDIGKFIFPDSILLTDRRLTDEEYEIVRRHPEVGAELIGEIEGYEEVAAIIRSHHERIDGCGYPDRLAGEEIPLGSRIIAVADIYDVITSRDTYRKPVTVPEAFAELRRSGGTQLDAALVEVFIRLVESRGVAFRHSTAADFEAELAMSRRVSDYAAPRGRVAA